ncbi:MAG TPA: nuclear transport factor 2 family protein [Candidatus Eisenbacteria bacterium]|nr:nuclear transport factor 2 family protein [Candidatus Eisenbacteria bacterium]
MTLLVLPIGSAAQPSSASAVRTEVLAFVRSFADAANHADVAAVMEMYDHSPNLISAADGAIIRGWDAVREDANQVLGKEGLYKISTGSFDVLPLGAGKAVAVGPVVTTVKTGAGPVTLDQVLTLVLEKKQGKWLIVHDHTSTKPRGD